MKLCTRRFVGGDAPECYEVFYRAVHEGAAAQYSAEQRAAWAPQSQMPENWPEKLGKMACWVAQSEGKVVGFFAMEGDGHLDLAYVAPEFRRSDAAGALYDRCLSDAYRLDLARIFTEASHLARRFFEKRGWEVTKPETVQRNGVEIDRFQMAIDLQSF